jgi:hypothetical protein
MSQNRETFLGRNEREQNSRFALCVVTERATSDAARLQAIRVRELEAANQKRTDARAASQIQHEIVEIGRLQIGNVRARTRRTKKRACSAVAPLDPPLGVDDEQRVGQCVEDGLGVVQTNRLRV